MIFRNEAVKKVKIDKITIPHNFETTRPHPNKLLEKAFNFVKGENIDKIYVDSCFNLIDGYCTYLIYKALLQMGYDGYKKVPVVMLVERKCKSK